jgi:hypothetical protein
LCIRFIETALLWCNWCGVVRLSESINARQGIERPASARLERL